MRTWTRSLERRESVAGSTSIERTLEAEKKAADELVDHLIVNRIPPQVEITTERRITLTIDGIRYCGNGTEEKNDVCATELRKLGIPMP